MLGAPGKIVSLRLSPAQHAALARGERPRPERRGKRTEALLAAQLAQADVGFEREYRFALDRRYRFDFRITDVEDLAVEIDGGCHTVRARFASDLDKHALAMLYGFRVLRVSPEQVRNGKALALIERLIATIRYKTAATLRLTSTP